MLRPTWCRAAATPPPPLPGISRENSLKILGVTITSHLSASDHIRQVISGSAQSLYALRVLRHHGLTAAGLHAVFCAVVVSRLTYASPAWTKLTRRPWRKISQETLDRALQSSALNSSGEQLRRLSAAELFDLYDGTLWQIADTIAPASTSLCCPLSARCVMHPSERVSS